jgi:hypothetical protein
MSGKKHYIPLKEIEPKFSILPWIVWFLFLQHLAAPEWAYWAMGSVLALVNFGMLAKISTRSPQSIVQ